MATIDDVENALHTRANRVVSIESVSLRTNRSETVVRDTRVASAAVEMSERPDEFSNASAVKETLGNSERTRSDSIVKDKISLSASQNIILVLNLLMARFTTFLFNSFIKGFNFLPILWLFFPFSDFSKANRFVVYDKSSWFLKLKGAKSTFDFCLRILVFTIAIVGVIVLFVLFPGTLNGVVKYSSWIISVCVAFFSIVGYYLSDNHALSSDMMKKFGVDLRIKNAFMGFGSIVTASVFTKSLHQQSDDDYIILNGNCIVFRDILNYSKNSRLRRDLETVATIRGDVKLFLYDSFQDTLTEQQLMIVKSRDMRKNYTSKEYGYMRKTQTDSKLSVLFLMSVVYLISVGLVAVFVALFVYGLNKLIKDTENHKCHGKYDRCTTDKVALMVFGSLMAGASFVSFLLFLPINNLTVQVSVYYESDDWFTDHNIDQIVKKSSYRALREVTSSTDFELLQLVCMKLNQHRYYLYDRMGLPIDIFRELLNELSFTYNRNITLKYGGRDFYILDSLYTSNSGTAATLLFYDEYGYCWVGNNQNDLKNTIKAKYMFPCMYLK